MNKLFIIDYLKIDDIAHEKEFVDAITSNFISKKARDYSYFIINDKKLSAQTIHKTLESKIDFKTDFIVVDLENFFGTFNEDAIRWLFEKFPDIDFINKANILAKTEKK